MGKDITLKWGFCNKIIDRKDLHTTKYRGKIIMCCPHCNAILGFSYV